MKQTRVQILTKAYLKKHMAEAKARLRDMDMKRSKKASFSWWAEWNAIEYIHWEFALSLWAVLAETLGRLIKEKKTDAEIVEWLVRVRDSWIEDVMKSTARHSTNQLGNMIEAEKVDVYRRLAGCNLSGDSLTYLIDTIKRT